jgi:NAD(P)-dependent dehydrogenase (short-subunit alcohol dehydrogenase family)
MKTTMKATGKERQTAIVTGASSGIGLGIAQALLERGFRVVANSRTISKSKELKASEDRLKKLVKLTVLMAATEQFVDHAAVADGASKIFAQIFGSEAGHTRLVYGVQSLPIGAPVIVDCVFEIKPA